MGAEIIFKQLGKNWVAGGWLGGHKKQDLGLGEKKFGGHVARRIWGLGYLVGIAITHMKLGKEGPSGGKRGGCVAYMVGTRWGKKGNHLRWERESPMLSLNWAGSHR